MTPPRFKAIERRGQSVLRMRPAWLSYWKYWLAIAAVSLLWMVRRPIFEGLAEIFGLPAGAAGLGLLIGLAPIAGKMLFHRYTHAYEIESGQKLRFVAGFISRVKREFPLTDKVQTDMGQSVIGRILNYGTIGFWTGDDRSRLVWKDVPDPDQVVAYFEHIRQSRPAPAHLVNPILSHQPSVITKTGGHSLPSAPTVEEARATGTTHFGAPSANTPRTGRIAKRIATPVGDYFDNGDGTVTDERAGLMWLRAPWGMVWNGSGFAGEPIEIGWDTATELFGRGVRVGYNVAEGLEASAFSNGYKPGRCNVHAAGYDDWRLPTAVELDRLTPYLPSHIKEITFRGHSLSGESLWPWHGNSGSISKVAFRRLYPELFQDPELAKRRAGLCSANHIDERNVWASFPHMALVGDCPRRKASGKLYALFVRNITGNEWKAAKTRVEVLKAE